jgi:hypothetical protein
MEISKPLFDKYKTALKYPIGYAWITLKNEEDILYNKMKDNLRIIFNLETIEKLPIYPFTFDDINQNPYACVMIDEKVLDIKNNCMSLEMMSDYTKYYGICTKNEFIRRLNIFINGENKKGVLNLIDWNSCAITGSIMAACAIKHNPLIDVCKVSNNSKIITDEDLLNFFLHYYNDSDVDMICNKKSMSEFIDVIDEFVNKLKTYNEPSNVKVEWIHTSSIIISDEFLENIIDDIRNYIGSDTIGVKYIRENFSSDMNLKKYFYDKYYVLWKELQKQTYNIKLDSLVNEYLKPIKIDELRMYSLDYDLEPSNNDHEKDIIVDGKIMGKMTSSIRFKVSSEHAKTFEIFRSKGDNFFSTVSRFHMGFVRAIWTGTDLLCLPSFVSSLMVQFTSEYKYFSSIRDPIENVNKYLSRGFGVVLNEFEKIHMFYYNTTKLSEINNEKWIEIYKALTNKYKNIFGPKKSSDEIFKPSKYFDGISEDQFINPKHHTISQLDEIVKLQINEFKNLPTDADLNELEKIIKMKSINYDGKIVPLDKFMLSKAFEIINNFN